MEQDKSALVILVPEADELVSDLREQFDVSAKAGLGAHITILFPFLAPERLKPSVLARLADLVASHASFDFALSAVERFPTVLYLATSPAAPFAELTEAVAAAFPECPPYGGAFAKPIPHLTVATAPLAQDLERVEREFRRRTDGVLPLHCTAREVTLVTKRTGQWLPVSQWPLKHDA